MAVLETTLAPAPAEMGIKELYDGFPSLLTFWNVRIYERLCERTMLDSLPDVQFRVHSQVNQDRMGEYCSGQAKVTCAADEQ